MSPITRRMALGTLAGTAGLGLASAAGLVLFCSRRPAAGSTAEQLGMAFDDLLPPVRVGLRYLLHHPEESDTGRLAKAIEHAVGDSGPAPIRCRADAVATLAAVSVADFRAGRVVWIDGWLMGRTEARVCAHLAVASGVA